MAQKILELHEVANNIVDLIKERLITDRVFDSELTNFGTWRMDNEDRIYRYWKKTEGKTFSTFASYGYIKEAIELPDGDILLGIKDADSETEYIEYIKLSDIRLVYSEYDQKKQ